MDGSKIVGVLAKKEKGTVVPMKRQRTKVEQGEVWRESAGDAARKSD